MPSELLRDTWSGAEDALRRRLGDEIYARWFAGLTLLSATDGEISLGVANRWMQDWIEARYLDEITGALRGLAGEEIEIRLGVDPHLFGKHRAEQDAVFGSPRDRAAEGGVARDVRGSDWRSVVVPDFPPDPGSLGVDSDGGATLARSGGAVGAPSVFPGSGTSTVAVGAGRARGSSKAARRAIRSLDDVVEGPCNLLAVRAARRLVESPGTLFNPLFVYGPAGSGKSAIAKAIHSSFVLEQEQVGRPSAAVRCLSAERFAAHFAACAQDRSLRKFRETYRSLDLLVIDDVQRLASKAKTQIELQYTIEALVDSGRQVVLIADRRPQALEDLDSSLVSRCLGGLVVRLDRADYATRREIARQHSLRLADSRVESSGRARTPWGAKIRRQHGEGAPTFEVTTSWAGMLDEEVLDFLADRFRKSVHDLMGAVLRLDVHGRILGRSPTAREAARVLADMLIEQRRRVGVAAIQDQVAEYFAVPIEGLSSRGRDRTLVFARHVAMYLLRRYADLSLREIGKCFGGRDASTVTSACKKISELVETGARRESADGKAALARDVFAIIDRLGEDEPR